MLSDISFWFTASFIVLTFVLLVVVVMGVLSVLRRAGTKNPRPIVILTAVGLLVWVFGTGFLGWAGFIASGAQCHQDL